MRFAGGPKALKAVFLSQLTILSRARKKKLVVVKILPDDMRLGSDASAPTLRVTYLKGRKKEKGEEGKKLNRLPALLSNGDTGPGFGSDTQHQSWFGLAFTSQTPSHLNFQDASASFLIASLHSGIEGDRRRKKKKSQRMSVG